MYVNLVYFSAPENCPITYNFTLGSLEHTSTILPLHPWLYLSPEIALVMLLSKFYQIKFYLYINNNNIKSPPHI